MQILNKRQDDFERKKDWDDYLESIEDMTFSLMSGTKEEKEAAEKQLSEYEENNKEQIRRNKDRAKLEKKAFVEKKEAIDRAAVMARKLAQKSVQEELAEQEERKKRQLQAMEIGGSAALEKVRKEFEEKARRRKEALLREEERIKMLKEGRELAFSTLTDGPNIDEEEYEWIPLGKDVPDKSDFYTTGLELPRECYIHASINNPTAAGGYSKTEWFEHALYAAFAGLTILPDTKVQEGTEVSGNSRTDVTVVDG